MENNFDQEGDEIIDEDVVDTDIIMEEAIDLEDAEFFEPDHIIFLNDPGLSLNQDAEPDQLNPSEASSDDIVMAYFSPDQIKAMNEFSIEKHTKVSMFSNYLYFNIFDYAKFKECSMKAGSGDLVKFLNRHWQTFVPICYNVLETPSRNLIDMKSNSILFRPLEVYLCNCIENEKALSKLKEFDDPPQLCGKVFKAGEPSYFCR